MDNLIVEGKTKPILIVMDRGYAVDPDVPPPMQSTRADAQYAFTRKYADMINSNLKLFWIAMGGKEDIATRTAS